MANPAFDPVEDGGREQRRRAAEYKAMAAKSLRKEGLPPRREKEINPLDGKPKTLTEQLIEDNSNNQ